MSPESVAVFARTLTNIYGTNRVPDYEIEGIFDDYELEPTPERVATVRKAIEALQAKAKQPVPVAA